MYRVIINNRTFALTAQEIRKAQQSGQHVTYKLEEVTP